MQYYRSEHEDRSPSMQNAVHVMRVAASVVGIVIMLIGLAYTMQIFSTVLKTLRAPDGISEVVNQWSGLLGDETLVVVFQGETYRVARITSIAILGAGAFLLAKIALAIMQAGGRIIQWTLSDRDAVKKILTEAFGPTGRAPVQAPPPITPDERTP